MKPTMTQAAVTALDAAGYEVQRSGPFRFWVIRDHIRIGCIHRGAVQRWLRGESATDHRGFAMPRHAPTTETKAA